MSNTTAERPIQELIKDWLNGSLSKPLLLVGEQGCGKTTLVQTIASLGVQFHQPGVIYLNLDNLTGLHLRLPLKDEMIAECLARGYYDEFPLEEYRERIKVETLVIVDGIERALAQLTPHDGEVLAREVMRFVRPNAMNPLMITCRPETLPVFQNIEKTKLIFMPRNDALIATIKAA